MVKYAKLVIAIVSIFTNAIIAVFSYFRCIDAFIHLQIAVAVGCAMISASMILSVALTGKWMYNTMRQPTEHALSKIEERVADIANRPSDLGGN